MAAWLVVDAGMETGSGSCWEALLDQDYLELESMMLEICFDLGCSSVVSVEQENLNPVVMKIFEVWSA